MAKNSHFSTFSVFSKTLYTIRTKFSIIILHAPYYVLCVQVHQNSVTASLTFASIENVRTPRTPASQAWKSSRSKMGSKLVTSYKNFISLVFKSHYDSQPKEQLYQAQTENHLMRKFEITCIKIWLSDSSV